MTGADLCLCGAPRHYHRGGTEECFTHKHCVKFAPAGAAGSRPALTDHATHGPYGLYLSLGDVPLMIRRLDDDGRRRTVAFVHSLEEWDRFVAALEAGANEVDAVAAVDVRAET